MRLLGRTRSQTLLRETCNLSAETRPASTLWTGYPISQRFDNQCHTQRNQHLMNLYTLVWMGCPLSCETDFLSLGSYTHYLLYK